MSNRDYNTRDEIRHVVEILKESESREVDLSHGSRIRRFIGPSEKDRRMRRLLFQDLRADGYSQRMILEKMDTTDNEQIPGLEPMRYIKKALINQEWFIDNCVGGRVNKTTNQITMF